MSMTGFLWTCKHSQQCVGVSMLWQTPQFILGTTACYSNVVASFEAMLYALSRKFLQYQTDWEASYLVSDPAGKTTNGLTDKACQSDFSRASLFVSLIWEAAD